MYYNNLFTEEELIQFYTLIGYSLGGFEELSFFEDCKIETNH